MKKLIAGLALASLAFGAYAEDTTSSANTVKKDLKTQAKKQEPKGITNAKLRAEMGSMSKFSVSASLGYVGSSVTDPFQNETPNPNNLEGDHSTYISGSISTRYRIDSSSSLSAGVGVVGTRPFDGFEETEAYNPYVGYSKTFRNNGMIHSLSSSFTKFTRESTKKIGWDSEISAGYTFLVPSIAGTGFTAGLSTSFYRDFFNGSSLKDKLASIDDYGMTIAPFAEYQVNDMFSLRTVVGQSFMHLRRYSKAAKMAKLRTYQTLGLGTAFTKEVYLYSYVKYYPEVSFSDNANINFSLTFSLF